MADSGGTTTTSPETTPFDGLTLRALLDQLSSREPIPGGGSAAALAGALGAALLSMVAALTVGRTASAADADTLTEIATAAAAAQADLLALVTLDADAYRAVVEARRLPRVSDEELAERSHRIQDATRGATEVPLRTARGALAMLDVAGRLVSIGNPHAISDVGVAAHLAAAAVRGAVLNVRINLPSLGELAPDDPLAAARDEIDELLARAAAGEARISVAVAHRMEG
ncbi:MAG: cyclodeaminase/cyclohydrolase family protein [Chloroflexota bacterium]